MKKASVFARFAQWTATQAGKSYTFATALLIVIAWGASGPLFHFSDTWQLVINTGTTIVTFLMVFLIQNSQNRDTTAIQAKLDELIRATKLANNAMLNLEDLDDETLDRLREHYRKLGERSPGDVEKMLEKERKEGTAHPPAASADEESRRA
jgi:low affinity Fe/Cu permease